MFDNLLAMINSKSQTLDKTLNIESNRVLVNKIANQLPLKYNRFTAYP